MSTTAPSSSPSIQRITGSFPGMAPYPITLNDLIQNGFGWSPGAQTIVPVTSQPTITNPWTILGWSITWSAWLVNFPGMPENGLLGRLYGGLILGGAVTPQQNQAFDPSSMPADSSNLAMLWDGGTDKTPPWSPANKFYLQPPNADTFSEQLPVPIQMGTSDRIGIGLWLTPSLGPPVDDTGSFNLGIAGRYAITYTTPH
jgi:hypothetical protein